MLYIGSRNQTNKKRFTDDDDGFLDDLGDVGSEFVKGIAAGTDQLQGLIGGGGRALIGSILDDEEMLSNGMAYYNEQMAEAAENAAEIGSIEDIEGFGDFVNYSAFVVGNVIPSLIGGGGAGAVGGMVAKRAAMSAAGKSLAKNAAGQLTKKQAANMYAASTVGREALAKRGLKGQMGGAFAFSAAAGGGESFTRILDETGEEAALTAIITGIASGGLDAVTPMRALKRILPQEQFKDAAEEVAGAVYRKRGVFSRALREAGKSGAAESVTETMQEIVQNGALEVVRGMGEDLEDSFIERMLDEGKLSQYKNAAVAGLVGGAGMGAFTGAIGQDPDRTEPTERQLQLPAPDKDSEAAPETTPEDDAAARAAQRREEVIQNSRGLPQKRREIPREDPSAARAAAQQDVADKSLPAQREQKTEEQATASRESIQAQIAEQVASLPKAREKAKQIIKEITEGQRGQGSYRNDGVGEKVTITPPDGPVSTTEVSGALPDPAATTPPMEGLVGQDVEYNGNKGLLVKKDDGYYISTQDNGDVLVESGLNKSPTELGVVPVSGDLKFENDFEIDTKTKKFNLRGEDYTLTRIIRDADGNALSLAVRDSKGKRKTIRTKSVVDRADAQMTPAPDFSQIQVEMDDLPAAVQKMLINESDPENIPDMVPAQEAISAAANIDDDLVEQVTQVASNRIAVGPNATKYQGSQKFTETVRDHKVTKISEAISEVNKSQGKERTGIDEAKIRNLLDVEDMSIGDGTVLSGAGRSEGGKYSDQVAMALIDLFDAGMPKSFLSNISGLRVHSELENPQIGLSDGSYSRSNGFVSINKNLLNLADKASETGSGNDANLRFVLAHELGHAFDVTTDHTQNSPEFMIEVDGMSPDNVTLDMGEVMHELASNYQSGTELGKEMAYPFGYSFDWLMNASADKTQNKLNTIRMEAFAQAFAVFHSSPDLLEQQAPLTYTYMKNILQTAPPEGRRNAKDNADTQEENSSPDEVRRDVQPSTQSRDTQVQVGDGDRGDGGSGPDARQASEGMGGQSQQEDGNNTGRPLQLERTPVVLKATDKKPTFKKAENYEETGEYIVTFADGDRYTLYFDDDAKEAGDEVYFTSEDGKVASLDGMLGETRQETIDELVAHRQKLIDAGENSYNTPLNPEVSSDTLFKGYNLVTDHPEGQLKLTDLRKKFRKLEDNQFDNLVERLTDSELDSEDLMVVQDGVISHPETVQEIEAERLAEERMIAEEADFDEGLQGLMDDDMLYAPSNIERLQEVDSSYNQAKVRSLSQLQERIPLDDRISGEYVEGQPLTPVSGGKFSDLDLSNRGDGLDISQADLESILTEAVRLTDTNAEGQVGDLAQKTVERLGINANTIEFWDRALKLSDNARYWYEVSAEAMRDVMPDLSDTEIKQFISVVAATSPVANPFVNMHRAMASFANNLQGRPIDNDLVIQKGVTDALKTSDLEGLKTGSFGGTMQLVLGMAKPTLSTNDRQVAATFNTDGEAIGKNPELYEVMSRFYMGLRDKLNANLPEGAQPYETWQLQALGWVEQRYKNEFVKDKKAEGMSEDAALSLYQSASPEEISGGVNDVDDYSMSLLREDTSGRRDRKGAIQVLKEAGIAVPNNKITREILLDPRVPAALSPTTANFREKRTITAEINSLRNDTGKDARSIFDAAVEQGNQQIADEYHAVFATLLNKSSQGKTNPFTAYFRAMGLTDEAKPTRVATPTGGVPLAVGGTYEGDVSPNIRVPVPASITGDQLNVLMTSLSKQWDQDAVPASHVTDMADGIREGYTETSQVFVETLDALSKDQIEAFANALPEGVEVNFTRYPNGYEFNVLAFDQETFDPITPDMNEVALAADQILVVDDSGITNIGTKDAQWQSAGYSEIENYDDVFASFKESLYTEQAQKLIGKVQRKQNGKVRDLTEKQIIAALRRKSPASDLAGQGNARIQRAHGAIKQRLSDFQQAEGIAKSLAEARDTKLKLFIQKNSKKLGIPSQSDDLLNSPPSLFSRGVRQDPSAATFSGKMDTKHGYRYDPSDGDSPVPSFVASKDFKGLRYDGDGGTFGSDGVYLEDASSPAFFNQKSMSQFMPQRRVNVEANFDKAFVFTPATIQELTSVIGVHPKDIKGAGRGAQIVSLLKEKGYDGLIVKDFKSAEMSDDKQAKKQLKREGMGAFDDDLVQPQVFAFYPEKLKVDADSMELAQDFLSSPPSKTSQEPVDLTKVIPKVDRAYKQFKAGKIDRDTFDNTVLDTISEYEYVPDPATYDEMFKALTSDKKPKINLEIEDGEVVGMRLDIPAYMNKENSAWVPALHFKKDGVSMSSYQATGSLTDVTFKASEKTSQLIMEAEDGKAAIDKQLADGLIDAEKAKKLKDRHNKSSYAKMNGSYVKRTDAENLALAKKALNDPDWTQVGFDPRRHSYFYDRKTGQPIVSAEEVIQVGPLVLAKKATSEGKTSSDFLYSPPSPTYDEVNAARNAEIREEKGKVDKASGWLKKTFKRQLTSRGLLNEQVFQAKVARDGEFGAAEIDTRMYLNSYDKAVKDANLSEEQTALLSEAIATPLDQLNSLDLPDAVKQAVGGMRKYLDKMSIDYAQVVADQALQLAQSGKGEAAAAKVDLLNTIASNKGKYLNRSYQVFDDPKWANKVPKPVIDNARTFLESNGAQNADRIINTILKTGTAFDGLSNFISEGKLGSKDLSILKKKKDIAPEILALMGEYTDPRINFVKTATKVSRLLWNHRFLEQVKLEGQRDGFLFTAEDAPTDAYVQIAPDSSDAMNPLNGLYTTPELAQGFEDAMDLGSNVAWVQKWQQVNSVVKYGKTVIAPTTVARNFMSASLFTVANGHFNWAKAGASLRSLDGYFSSKEGDATAYLREIRRLGVVYDSPYAGELTKALEDFSKGTELDNKVRAIDGKKDKVVQWSKGFLDLMAKNYQYGDDFWKIIGFENMVDVLMDNKGLTREQAMPLAAERIRDTYPTYSLIGKGIKDLRRFPLVGTFVSFPAEIVRTSFNMFKYLKQDMADPDMKGHAMAKVAGMSAVSFGIYALQDAAMRAFDVDEEEQEAIRLMSPTWSENSNILPTGRDDDGNLEYIDLTYLDPYAYFKKPINALMRDQPTEDAIVQAGRELLTPFLGVDIATGTVLELYNNEKVSGGRIWNPADTPTNKLSAATEHLTKGAGPAVIQNFIRTGKAINGDVSKSGKRYELEDELKAWVGFRVTTFDPKISLHFKAYEFNEDKRNASSLLTSTFRDPNQLEEGELINAFERASSARKEGYERMIKLVSAARKSGLSNTQLMMVLRSNGVTKKDARALIAGNPATWEMSDSTLKNSVKKSDLLFGESTGKEFQDRWKIIQQMLKEEAR